MRKVFLFVLIWLANTFLVFSQDCNGGFTITTQEQLNALSTLDCTRITGGGGVDISGPDIISLQPLEQFSYIYTLSIHDVPNLLSFAGTNSLTGLYTLSLWGELPLTISGFNSVQNIGETLSIIGTNSHTIMGFLFLGSVGALRIQSNSYLSIFPAFHFLSTIGYPDYQRGLVIDNNPLLEDIIGLKVALMDIYGPITISSNGLHNLDFLSAIGSCFYLTIQHNGDLQNLLGLSGMRSVNELRIINNGLLTSLAGIDNIDPETISFLQINDCPNLSVCSFQNICEYLADGGANYISYNGPGCENNSAITYGCAVGINSLPHNPIFFPNPVSELLTLKNASNFHDIKIFNVIGESIPVDIIQENNDLRMNLSNLASGIYFVNYISNGQSESIKFCKE